MKKTCFVLYAIYALTALMQFDFYFALLGSLFILVAVYAAYREKEKAAGSVYESHFHWMIRTFWIGSGVYMPVLAIAASLVLASIIDVTAVMDQLISGEISDPLEMQARLVETYGGTVRLVTIASSAPMAAWWFWRLWKGITALRAGKPVENVKSWL